MYSEYCQRNKINSMLQEEKILYFINIFSNLYGKCQGQCCNSNNQPIRKSTQLQLIILNIFLRYLFLFSVDLYLKTNKDLFETYLYIFIFKSTEIKIKSFIYMLLLNPCSLKLGTHYQVFIRSSS